MQTLTVDQNIQLSASLIITAIFKVVLLSPKFQEAIKFPNIMAIMLCTYLDNAW